MALKKVYDGAVAFTSDNAAGDITYIPFAEAFMTANWDDFNIYRRMYHDGTNNRLGAHGTGPTSIGVIPIDNDTGAIIRIDDDLYHMNPITWSIDLVNPLKINTTIANVDNGPFFKDDTGTLKHYRVLSNGYNKSNVDTGAIEETVVVPGALLMSKLHHVTNQLIFLIRHDTGLVIFFDVQKKVVTLTTKIDVCVSSAYDKKYGNIVTITADKKTHIWSTEVQPTTLDALVFNPAAFARYTTEAVSVTVKGADGELVEGAIVDWELVNITAALTPNPINTNAVNVKEINEGNPSGAKGRLCPLQSITNALGVATTTYCPPGNDWVAGEKEIITAKVTV